MEELSFKNFDQYLLKQKGKIIHQIWFGTIPNKRAARKTYQELQKYRDSWILKNPKWTYICWNLDRCNELVKNYYLHHKEMYDNYIYPIQKCDTIRYFILHRYGGLYADMDYYCVRSWDEVIKDYPNDFYLVETPNKLFDKIHISNSLMYSCPGHPYWNKLFIELEQNQISPPYYSKHMTIMFTTGPAILNRVFKDYYLRYHLKYYPYKLFHPYGLSTDIENIYRNPNVYAIHMGKGSWESDDSKLIIFLYQEYKILTIIVGVLLLVIFLQYII